MAKFQKLRIASYNIRKAVGLDRRRNPGRIIDVINEIGADVVALQEVDRRLGERKAALPHRLVEANTDFDVVPIATNDVSLGWHGNALLVRKGLPVSKFSNITLPGLEPRGAISMTLEMDDTVTIAAVHLGLVRRHRRQQLRTLTEALTGASNAIVLGDFNEWSLTRGLEPFADFDVIAPGATFHAARPVAALDRIALQGGLTCSDAGVEQHSLARRASDHLPIWADVELADPGARTAAPGDTGVRSAKPSPVIAAAH